MDVIITEWALDSYLNLKHSRAFSVEDYKETIRPDVELLKEGMPFKNPKFFNDKFWSPAKDKNKKVIPDAFKMKWHNLGDGKVQLRLLVVIHAGKALLCQAYVKPSEQLDHREAAKLKLRIPFIYQGNYVTRGEL